MTSFRRHSFKTLDGIRGVAAISVMLSHFRYVMYLPAFKSGYLAVDIFFCLSGFVVACAYEDRLRDSLTVGRFVRIRLVRFWPMMALGVASGALIYSISAVPYPPGNRYDYFYMSVVFNLAFVPMLFGQNSAMFIANHPEWSLFYELIINIVYGIFIKMLNLFQILAILSISSIILSVGIFKFGNANIGWDRSQLIYGFARVSYGFFAGVLLFRYRENFAGFLFKRGAFFVLLMTAAVCTLPAGNLRMYFDLLFVIVGAPILVLWGSNTNDTEYVDKISVFLGVISYPLYAIHFPMAVLADVLSNLIPSFRVPIALAVLATTVPLSYYLAKFYDEPFRRLLSRA